MNTDKLLMEKIKQATAIWQRQNGITVALMPSVSDPSLTPIGFFEQILYSPYHPEDRLRAFSFNALSAKWLAKDARKGEIRLLKTPGSYYHVWHICFCKECRGKIWTHSQSDWDTHLRHVDPQDVVDFPSAEYKSAEEIYDMLFRQAEEIHDTTF